MKKNIYGSALLGLFMTSLCATGVIAEENLWVYTKGTDTRPEGSYELKLSNISRMCIFTKSIPFSFTE